MHVYVYVTCMYICRCIWICTRVRTWICPCIYMYTGIYRYMCEHEHKSIYMIAERQQDVLLQLEPAFVAGIRQDADYLKGVPDHSSALEPRHRMIYAQSTHTYVDIVHLCIYVGMYVCRYIYICECISMRRYFSCVHLHINKRIGMHRNTIHRHTHTCRHTHTYMYRYLCIHMYIWVYVCIHIEYAYVQVLASAYTSCPHIPAFGRLRPPLQFQLAVRPLDL